MRTAILGWGSLIWEPGNMTLSENWKPGGPRLPIEFSRISNSRNKILTLVIDPDNGELVQTLFAVSGHTDLDRSICELRIREGTSPKHIGYVNLLKDKYRKNVLSEIRSIVQHWAAVNGFDAAIWTNLPPNFREKRDVEFSLENAVSYLETLPEAGKEEARKYIIRAPLQITTPLRRKLSNDRWLFE